MVFIVLLQMVVTLHSRRIVYREPVILSSCLLLSFVVGGELAVASMRDQNLPFVRHLWRSMGVVNGGQQYST